MLKRTIPFSVCAACETSLPLVKSDRMVSGEREPAMKTKAFLVGMLAVVSTGILQGCVAVMLAGGAAVGAGARAYATGDTEAVLAQDVDQVCDASKKALAALEIPIIRLDKDGLKAKLIARASDDKKITIVVKRTGDRHSKLSVRVGIFGDRARSRAIYDQIRKNL